MPLTIPGLPLHFIVEGLDRRFLVQYHSVMQPDGYLQTAQGRLDATFSALADPTRRAILARLSSGEASVTELAGPFAMTQPAISKHLKVLERAGLISRDRDAQRRPSRLVAKPLAEASKWLEHYRRFWEISFQRLDGLLDELQGTAKKPNRPANRKR
jgi:DNA-binding transcriptional ArsR family regulator